MVDFLVKRLAAIVPTLFFVSVLIFGLQQLLPGDPAIAMAGEDHDPNAIAYLRAQVPPRRPAAGALRLLAAAAWCMATWANRCASSDP